MAHHSVFFVRNTPSPGRTMQGGVHEQDAEPAAVEWGLHPGAQLHGRGLHRPARRLRARHQVGILFLGIPISCDDMWHRKLWMMNGGRALAFEE